MADYPICDQFFGGCIDPNTGNPVPSPIPSSGVDGGISPLGPTCEAQCAGLVNDPSSGNMAYDICVLTCQQQGGVAPPSVAPCTPQTCGRGPFSFPCGVTPTGTPALCSVPIPSLPNLTLLLVAVIAVAVAAGLHEFRAL